LETRSLYRLDSLIIRMLFVMSQKVRSPPHNGWVSEHNNHSEEMIRCDNGVNYPDASGRASWLGEGPDFAVSPQA
jgi:hypothetical protein